MGEDERYDWAGHYQAGDTPWDLGAPHPELSQRLSDGELAPPEPGARALVPGAGRCHDAQALARRGWAVTALDLVPAAGEAQAAELLRRGGAFVAADALEFAAPEPFSLVWDHTFFCALPLGLRAAWGRRVAHLVAQGGRYAALVFPTGKPAEEGGPPFGMSADDLRAALGDAFELESDRPVQRAVARRTWPERLALFRRVAGA